MARVSDTAVSFTSVPFVCLFVVCLCVGGGFKSISFV